MACLYRSIILLSYIAVSLSLASKMPPGITACFKDDPDLNDCALKSAQAALPFLIKGNLTLGMAPMDPLHSDEMMIDDQGSHRQLPLTVVLKNIDIVGLKDIKFKSFNINLNTGRVKWTGVVPRLEMTANYSGSGRIAFMPVKGKGGLNTTMLNVVVAHSFKLTKVQKKRGPTRGQIFTKITDSTLTTDMDRSIFDIQNLFNGDKRLEDHMNAFLNDNWEVLHEELGPSFNHILSTSFNNLIGKVTSLVPYNELFPETN